MDETIGKGILKKKALSSGGRGNSNNDFTSILKGIESEDKGGRKSRNYGEKRGVYEIDVHGNKADKI